MPARVGVSLTTRRPGAGASWAASAVALSATRVAADRSQPSARDVAANNAAERGEKAVRTSTRPAARSAAASAGGGTAIWS